MFAVIRSGGKQYRVEEGRALKIDRVAGEPGDTVELRDVLLMADGADVTVGAPAVKGARVLAEIAQQGRDPKVIVFRYKAKTRSRKKTGHRQHFTRVIVRDILAAGQEPKPREAPAEPAPEPEAPKGRRRGLRSRRKVDEATAAAAGTEESQSAEAEGTIVSGETTPETAAAEAENLEASAEAAPAMDAAPVAEPTEAAPAPEEKPKRGRRRKTE